MWKQLEALITFEAFCKGCEIYHEMLVALGLAVAAPAANRTPLTDQSLSEPPISPIHMTDIYAMKGSRNIPLLVAPIRPTHNIYHLN